MQLCEFNQLLKNRGQNHSIILIQRGLKRLSHPGQKSYEFGYSKDLDFDN